ncbi:MAG: DUF1599 domain-containing protein [Bacteroidetes bacterium]|nr:MAG: DUF1599 domain-containing protein [Bacteroidota bacterium]
MTELVLNTSQAYDAVIAAARHIFLQKAQDYGTSWRVLRPISVVDQIYIKACRIRQLQQGGVQMVADGLPDEWRGIINYCVIGLIQLQLNSDDVEELAPDLCQAMYNDVVGRTKALMQLKNNDYGEAWRQMSHESFADLILMKLYRMKQIIRNQGKTLVSEGLDANYMDILNYAVFAMILNYPSEANA